MLSSRVKHPLGDPVRTHGQAWVLASGHRRTLSLRAMQDRFLPPYDAPVRYRGDGQLSPPPLPGKDGCVQPSEEPRYTGKEKRGCAHKGPLLVEGPPEGIGAPRRAKCLVCGALGPARATSTEAAHALRLGAPQRHRGRERRRRAETPSG